MIKLTLRGFIKKFWIKKLAGNYFYQYVCAFEEITDMWNAIRYILRNYSNRNAVKVESYTDTDIFYTWNLNN